MTDSETDSSYSDASISGSNIPVFPEYVEEFRILCRALQRNDPNVTSFSTGSLDIHEDEGYGRDLGHALQRNTIVSEIELDLTHVVPIGRNMHPNRLSEETELLFHWMAHSCSLRTVKIRAGPNLNHVEGLLVSMLEALVKHGNLQTFVSRTPDVSLSLYTQFLQANTLLQALELRTTLPDDDNDVEASARAVAALPVLEALTVRTSQIEPFLRHLPASPAFDTTLQQLTLNFTEQNRHQSGSACQVGVLCEVLSDRNCRLQHLVLYSLRFDERSWTLLSAAMLQSNPTSVLRTLELGSVRFSRESAPMFLRDMQAHPLPLQRQEGLQLQEPQRPQRHYIPDLRLTTRCTFDMPRQATEIGNMLCGSLLQQFTLSMYQLEQQSDFFSVLATQSSSISLSSMHLLNADLTTLGLLAPYIATTVHLRHLTVESMIVSRGMVPVPDVFLSSLRQNGSLYTVDLSSHGCTPNDEVLHRIQVYTTRNQVLPQLMATTLFGSTANRRPHNGAELPSVAVAAFVPPSAGTFPTLGTVAEHTPRMAPNTFLKAFLAASESLVPERQQSDV